MTRPLVVFCLFTFAQAQAPSPDHAQAPLTPRSFVLPSLSSFPNRKCPTRRGTHKSMASAPFSLIIVDRKGLPETPCVVRCTDPIFAENSLKAIKRYRLKPATTRGGQPACACPYAHRNELQGGY